MKKKIITALLMIIMTLVIVACDWCFWNAGSPSRECIMQSVHATETYGASQWKTQEAAMP